MPPVNPKCPVSFGNYMRRKYILPLQRKIIGISAERFVLRDNWCVEVEVSELEKLIERLEELVARKGR